jgi:hypothetical protein
LYRSRKTVNLEMYFLYRARVKESDSAHKPICPA